MIGLVPRGHDSGWFRDRVAVLLYVNTGETTDKSQPRETGGKEDTYNTKDRSVQEEADRWKTLEFRLP